MYPQRFYQPNLPGTTFKVNALISNGKKSKEQSTRLKFSEKSFFAANQKTKAVIKEFNFADVVSADYSYSEKPRLSGGRAVTQTILIGLIVIPFLSGKKKQHWLSVRTSNDYVVLRLNKDNYRQILNEFEIHKVAVKTIDEEESNGQKKKAV